MDIGKAAEIFEHYVVMALTSADVRITSDMREELFDAVNAFKMAADHIVMVTAKP